MRHVAVQGEPKGGECLALLRLRNVHPDKADHPLCVQLVRAGGVRHVTRLNEFRRLATRMIDDHPNGVLQPLWRECRIDAPFKPIAGV